jgi:bifunctional DNA-binding transcriptional regulator/antitoxin component of YhaV-PrlF toxin-antitoxin module
VSVTVKHNKADLMVPPRVRRQAGIKAGDKLEFKASRGLITILATPGGAAGEYTPEQRRFLDREIAKGLEDIKKGRTYGPFHTAEQMAASIEANIKKSRRPGKKSKPVR